MLSRLTYSAKVPSRLQRVTASVFCRSVPEGERVPPAAATPGPAPGPTRGCRTQRALPLRAARHRTKVNGSHTHTH